MAEKPGEQVTTDAGEGAPSRTAVTGPPPALVTQPGLRVGLVFVIVLAIVGTAWLIGQRQGFGDIGDGGMNASLLPKVGETAPEVITLDTNGNVIQLSAFRGRPVWLNFWGSWCPPCRSEFPDVEAAWQELKPRGLVLLGVAVGEDPLVAQDYANRVGGTFPILADPAYLGALLPEEQAGDLREMASSYTINNYPTHIFIDADGVVQRVVLAQMTSDEMMQYASEIIGPESATPAA